MKARIFRSHESREFERVTRDMLGDFLTSRGFSVVSDKREHNGQTIVATTLSGKGLTMRVRLCWRRGSEGRDSTRVRTYSGAQLLAHIENDDPEQSLHEKIEREKSHGITHFLFVQRDGERIVYAALVPLEELLAIWCDERDISARLIEQGRLVRTKKNHALNGSSPTLYLQDDRASQVAAALWNHRGVRDLAKLEPIASVGLQAEEADRSKSNDAASYYPQEGDRRPLIERQIRERRGQQQFRDVLRQRYGDRCLVTGCEVLSVLEAAHIKPYRGEDDNHPENGLLLRSDIHTLFDLDLIGIEPDGLLLELDPTVGNDYGCLAGERLGCPSDRRPSREALKLRYEQFRQTILSRHDLLSSAPPIRSTARRTRAAA